MQKLWANGVTTDPLCKVFSVARGTVNKYCKGIIRLPSKLQKNPFKDFQKGCSVEEVVENLEDINTQVTQRELIDIKYWEQNHTPGKRWEGPISNIEIRKLAEIMETPTCYHSPLTLSDWYNHYVGKSLLKYPPHTLSETQLWINDFLVKHKRALVLVFRGGGKTVYVVGKLIREICEDREGNYFVQSKVIGISRKRVQAVRAELMTNKLLISDYGYLPHRREYAGHRATWSKTEFSVKRETTQVDPTLIALSWKQGETLGSHFKGGIFDDPWSRKLQKQAPKSIEDWFDWYDSTFVPCMEMAEFEHFICTYKALDDIYHELEDVGMHHIYKQPAIIKYPSEYHYIKDEFNKIVGVKVDSDDWEISDDCHGRFSIEKFLMLKEQMKHSQTISFEAEYQLNPLPPKGIAFKWDDLRFFNNIQDFYDLLTDNKRRDKYMKIIGCMDLAFGKKIRSDYTALVILGFVKPNYYLLQIYLNRGGNLAKKAKMINSAKTQFPRMNVVYIEADLQQTAAVDELCSLIQSVAVKPVLSRQEEKALKPSSTEEFSSKDLRIMTQFENPLELNQLWINKHCNHFDEFEREFRYFPRSLHKDVLDAIGNGLSRLKQTRAILYGVSWR